MIITKYGHCCLLIEEGGLMIMTDPGGWSAGWEDVPRLDVLLLTHEHPDHFHLEAVQQLAAQHTTMTIMANPAVGALLHEAGIPYVSLGGSEQKIVKGVLLEGYGQEHAPIYPGVPLVENTGFMIAERLWYPGDAFTVPDKPVEILALPVAGPWLTIAQALDYAKQLTPAAVFPVHDGMLRETAWLYRHPERFLTAVGISFVTLEHGLAHDFS